ncbi:uncharacterized protein [Littorina saxatilis]|uniref:Uncharacterized protein n=1 Tax=Littorina saxatilis TaxID=31220 RepID=A0AAN9GL85_9CAEN
MFPSWEFFVILVICVGEVQLAGAAEVHYSVPVEQAMSRRCSSVLECPDYFDNVSWNNDYHMECCHAQKGPLYHCQQTFIEEHGSHTKVAVVCVWPKTCAAGNYAHVNQWTTGGLEYAEIECLPCTHDRFQPYPRDSFKFRLANCSNVFQKCLKENGLVLARNGNATHDNLCRCWWEGGYSPTWNPSKCGSLNGFNQDDCQCSMSIPCPDGEGLNQDFICVKQPSTTTSTTSSPPTKTTTTKGKNQANGDSITTSVLSTTGALAIFFCLGVV